jgi:hypothetical protein
VATTEDFDSFYAAAFTRLVGQLARVLADRLADPAQKGT